MDVLSTYELKTLIDNTHSVLLISMKGKWGANTIDANLNHKNGVPGVGLCSRRPHLGIVTIWASRHYNFEEGWRDFVRVTVKGRHNFPLLLGYKNEEDA